MSRTFVKVFRQILHSTIADHWQARIVFEDMLLLCDDDGVVDMTPSAIIAATRLPRKVVETGLASLEQPDPMSRSQECEGRRIVRIDPNRSWGWRIVNFRAYLEHYDEESIRTYFRTKKSESRSKTRNGQSKTCPGQVKDGPGQSRTVKDNSLPSPPLSPVPPIPSRSLGEGEGEGDREESPPPATVAEAASDPSMVSPPAPEGSGGDTEGLVGEKNSVEVAAPGKGEIVAWFMAQPLSLVSGADGTPEHLRHAWILRLAGWIVDQASKQPKNWRRFVQTRFEADVTARHKSLFPGSAGGGTGTAALLSQERTLSRQYDAALQTARKEGTAEAWDLANRLKKELEVVQQRITGGQA